MRFFQRARNVIRRNSRNRHPNHGPAANVSLGDGDQFNRSMFRLGLFQNFHANTANREVTDNEMLYCQPGSMQPEMQSYIPKCIGGTSTSEILQGSPPSENFVPNCGLNCRLHMFGNEESLLTTRRNDIDDDVDLDDSATGTISSSSSVSVDSFSGDSIPRSFLNVFHFPQVNLPDYSMAIEAPPNGFPDSPPTYEEATGIFERLSQSSSSNSSWSSRSSSIDLNDFYLY